MRTASSPSSALPRLLLVEDEALVRMVVAEELALLGFAVTEAASSAAAVASLEKIGDDIVAAIVDVGLPDGRGDDLAFTMRSRWPGLAVVMVSGYDESTLRKRFGTDAGVAFLRKPYFAEDLVKTLAGFGVSGKPSTPITS